jgi:NAD+ diphosphatase
MGGAWKALPTFAGGDLNRSTEQRARANALYRDTAARVLPMWRGKPLFRIAEEAMAPLALGWLDTEDALLAGAPDGPLFLGTHDGAPRFALDVSHLGPEDDGSPRPFLDAETLEPAPGLAFMDLRAVMAQLDPVIAGDAATAKGVIEWHRTHRHCARCGAPTSMEDGGWRRGCAACGAKHFPRTDPVVIMLVLHGDTVLLGRQAIWPERMYSLLAGFMEPGETVEEAVRRETVEESGVPVGRVGYVCSQPWPFPSSLMLGCVAEAMSDAIALNDAELEDAIWAPRAEVAAALSGGEARFSAARRGAVARVMLEGWVNGHITLEGVRP